MGYAVQPFKMPGGTSDRILNPHKSEYILHGQVLETVTCARYLGIDSSSNNYLMELSYWSCCWNANRRNIKRKSEDVRKSAYNTIVRPQLEYASRYGTRIPKNISLKLKWSQKVAGAQWPSGRA